MGQASAKIKRKVQKKVVRTLMKWEAQELARERSMRSRQQRFQDSSGPRKNTRSSE